MLTRIAISELIFLSLLFLFLSAYEVNEIIDDWRATGVLSAPLFVSVVIEFLSPLSVWISLAMAFLWSLVISLLPADKVPCMVTSVFIFILAFIIYAMASILISPELLLNGTAVVTPLRIVGNIFQLLGVLACLVLLWRRGAHIADGFRKT